jgi:proliferating cell nuclear antigen
MTQNTQSTTPDRTNPSTETEPESSSSSSSDSQPNSDSSPASDTTQQGETTQSSAGPQLSTIPLSPPSLFSAQIKASLLQHVLTAVRAVVDEARLSVDQQGISLRAADGANVAMADLRVRSEAFTKFAATEGTLGVNFTQLADVVSMADSEQTVSLTLDSDTRKLHIEFQELEYTLATIDPQSMRRPPEIPEFKTPVSIISTQRQLNRALTSANMLSDHLRLTADPQAKQLTAFAEGDTDKVELTLTTEDLTEFALTDDSLPPDSDTVVSLFALEYLTSFKSAIPKDAELTLHIGDEAPLTLHLPLADGDVTLTYILAPRIQSS